MELGILLTSVQFLFTKLKIIKVKKYIKYKNL